MHNQFQPPPAPDGGVKGFLSKINFTQRYKLQMGYLFY